MALGALIIQTKFQYSDRELVEQIAENPYLQYFIGLPGFREEAPFDASTLVLFRKRISAEMLMEVNEYLLAHKDDDKDDHPPPSGGKTNDDGTAKEDTHKGTLTLDATCAPANIRYPQDISLLNEAREKLETMIYRFCKCYGLKLPRRYRKCARKEYLTFAKSRKRTAKKIRSALRRQLGYVKRDLGYLEQFMSDGYAMTGKDIGLYLTIIRLYEQQQYMYDNRVHSVEHRIVSISQPWLRPIVRGKVKAPVEFGAKFDLSLDSEGYGRIEKISFEAYNESTCLIEAIDRKKTHCPRSTKYYENNAFYIFKESIFYFCFGCSYMYPNGEFCPKVFKINLHEDIININPTHLSHLPFHLEYTVQSYLTLSNVFFQFYPSLILYHHYY